MPHEACFGMANSATPQYLFTMLIISYRPQKGRRPHGLELWEDHTDHLPVCLGAVLHFS